MPELILPEPLEEAGFNPKAKIPFGVTTEHIRAAMQDFIEFLSVIDGQLHTKGMGRFENLLMQANFSSMVGGNDFRQHPETLQGGREEQISQWPPRHPPSR